MKATYLYRQPLLVLFLCITGYCNGQFKTAGSKQKWQGVVKPCDIGPNANIRCSLQDKDGNLWFGTTGAGIYRYDGKTFTNFSKMDGLLSNIVYCMLEDKNGIIWCGTQAGLYRYTPSDFAGRKKISFTRFPVPGLETSHEDFFNGMAGARYAANASIPAKPVYSIVEDKAGNIWLGTGKLGLYRYDGKTFTNFQYCKGAWRRMPADSVRYNKDRQKNDIQCLIGDKNGHIWFSAAGHEGVFRYDGKTFTQVIPTGANNSGVICMLEDKAGNLWFGTGMDGVYRYDGTAFTYFTEKTGLCSNSATSMVQDKKGHIWISSSFNPEAGRRKGCITRYDGKTFTHFPMKELAHTSIWNLAADSGNNIWFGTDDIGLYRYNGSVLTNFSGQGTR